MTGSGNDDRTPVIVGVGEIADRPLRLANAREPADLMLAALRRAEADAAVSILSSLESLDIINEISWPYPDPCALMTQRLALPGLRAAYHPVGGQTPLMALHEAALRIQDGECQIAAICGAEAEQTVRQARKAGYVLPWTAPVPDFQPIRGAHYQSEISRTLDLASPANVYPLYENATRAFWGQTFDGAQAESAAIWVGNAAIARSREVAWIQRDVTAAEIVTPSAANRLIAWPYTKLMTANPVVNQGAAVILCSVAKARSLGIAPEQFVYFRGGSAADEPRDFLKRENYVSSNAMNAVLVDSMALLKEPRHFAHVELYSCFPCVPKMARRILNLSASEPLSVTGGLTFFGAALNNYMTHATVAMVERLRNDTDASGLLYGQGEYVTKHHALVLSASPPSRPLARDYRRLDVEAALQQQVSALLDRYQGRAVIETYTVLFDRQAAIRHGAVIARTSAGARLLARVPATDSATINPLLDNAVEPVGMTGTVSIAADGICEWIAG